jgi:hypothetical protein
LLIYPYGHYVVDPLHDDCDAPDAGDKYLTVYEYAPGRRPRRVPESYFERFDRRALRNFGTRGLLERILPNHYVWSHVLVDALLSEQRSHADPDLDFAPIKIPNWNPPLFGMDALIEECVDFSDLTHSRHPDVEGDKSSSSRREEGKRRTQARHHGWQQEYRRLKKKHQDKSNVWIANKIAGTSIGGGASADTIRKNMIKRK